MKVIFENVATGHQILIGDEPVKIEELEARDVVSPGHYPYKPTVIVRMEQNGVVTRWAEEGNGRFEYTDRFLGRQLHKWFYKDAATGEIAPARPGQAG